MQDALSGSARRLEDTKAVQRELAPKLAELRRANQRNHFEAAVLAGFRVVDR